MTNSLTAVSLFSSGGLGDLALRQAGFDILVSNELLEDRHQVFSLNFPSTKAISGDIRRLSDIIVDTAVSALAGRELTLLYATPPCQGMSKNGRGKLLSEIRAGRKPALDERNRLILPTLAIARRLRPEIIVLENVPEMQDTIILDDNGRAWPIVDYARHELGTEYVGSAEIVEFANYGVPQCRQRLISIFSRSRRLRDWFHVHRTFIPPPTHAENPAGRYGLKRWVSVRNVIAGLPPLDARSNALSQSAIPFHSVPTLDERKYWWVSNTPPEKSAFDNQCVECGCQENLSHCAERNDSGINRASEETPLYCLRCGKLLPRPCVEEDGKLRIMRGFTSAYKRMSYDRPASALTRNLSYACSDNKLHPEQNRVLSLFEAFKLHTLDQFEYIWRRRDRKPLSHKTVREIIGESIPPAGFLRIIDHVANIYLGDAAASSWLAAGPLFSSMIPG